MHVVSVHEPYLKEKITSRISTRLGFWGVMKSTMIRDENDDLAIVIPYAMTLVGVFLACCLLFAHLVRKRRRGESRRATVVERQRSYDEESVATTMGVYNGVAGVIRVGIISRDSTNGERTSLLENDAVIKYNSDTR
jgi:hypothetical protein